MIITIDAMGTQTAIAETIIDMEGDYVLSVKENQPNLFREVSNLLECGVITEDKEELKNLQDAGLYTKTIEKGHGRIETRECFICDDISSISMSSDWKGLKGFGVILSKREIIGKAPTLGCGYFIHSPENTNAAELLHIKRNHWAIENNLHWSLDVVFKEDDSRITLNNAPENLNILRKQAMQLLKDESSFNASMTSKRYRCSLDIDYALKAIGVK
jgi:predicted transposase YbfD/YdcC